MSLFGDIIDTWFKLLFVAVWVMQLVQDFYFLILSVFLGSTWIEFAEHRVSPRYQYLSHRFAKRSQYEGLVLGRYGPAGWNEAVENDISARVEMSIFPSQLSGI